MDATTEFRRILNRNGAGESVGIVSICSANTLVLQAAMERAAGSDGLLLIEATCNQVNQDGGYTGLTPAAFRDQQWAAADAAGLPRARLLLGGDHLGPNPWRDRPAAEAMARAKALVAAYAAAGYRKLHLDASMACADDPPAVPPETIARRAAELCAVAEAVAAEAPVYVIGTEVPTPGGAHGALEAMRVTAPADVAHTLALHRAAFPPNAFARAVAVVVQPGVEFGQDSVHDFDPERAHPLASSGDQLVFEAHSTDYQRAPALRALVEARFAILKVGPELTFALREALFALGSIAGELGHPTDLRTALDDAMARDPRWWHPYMAPQDRVGRLFGLSDRVRYYWPDPAVDAAVSRLLAMRDLPPTLVSQYLPAQHAAWRDGGLDLTPTALVRHKVESVLDRYAAATAPAPSISRRYAI